jgi:hypothetical protein
MKLEDSIEKDVIVGIPSGEVLFVKDIEKVKALKKLKLIWIRVMPDAKFASVFADRDLKRVKDVLNTNILFIEE